MTENTDSLANSDNMERDAYWTLQIWLPIEAPVISSRPEGMSGLLLLVSVVF
jgi:hypothetical protein